MATLSKHGEIGQIEYLSYRAAYCQDGQILRNQGDGWLPGTLPSLQSCGRRSASQSATSNLRYPITP